MIAYRIDGNLKWEHYGKMLIKREIRLNENYNASHIHISWVAISLFHSTH